MTSMLERVIITIRILFKGFRLKYGWECKDKLDKRLSSLLNLRISFQILSANKQPRYSKMLRVLKN